ARERVRESCAQRSEPRLIVPPLVERLTIDRLAHLLRARSAHATLGPIELDAGFLELEPTIIEDSPDVPFEIAHDILILDAQHATRKHRVPVAQELEVGAVVTRNIRDTVGKLLPAGEELLQVAEATGHRLAPRI